MLDGLATDQATVPSFKRIKPKLVLIPEKSLNRKLWESNIVSYLARNLSNLLMQDAVHFFPLGFLLQNIWGWGGAHWPSG